MKKQQVEKEKSKPNNVAKTFESTDDGKTKSAFLDQRPEADLQRRVAMIAQRRPKVAQRVSEEAMELGTQINTWINTWRDRLDPKNPLSLAKAFTDLENRLRPFGFEGGGGKPVINGVSGFYAGEILDKLNLLYKYAGGSTSEAIGRLGGLLRTDKLFKEMEGLASALTED